MAKTIIQEIIDDAASSCIHQMIDIEIALRRDDQDKVWEAADKWDEDIFEGKDFIRFYPHGQLAQRSKCVMVHLI